MLLEPNPKKAIAFFDGQNLFHAAKEAFGYTYPNYDPLALAGAVCKNMNWNLAEVRFYTGVPELLDNKFWYDFWTAKLAHLGRQGGTVYSRALRYRNRPVRLPDGSTHAVLVGEEKGIDVRIAIDIIQMAHHKQYDVGLVFSQDQDLSEAAREIRLISSEQRRWIKIACAYPVSPASQNKRGINGTDWIHIDRGTFDSALDSRDYRSNDIQANQAA